MGHTKATMNAQFDPGVTREEAWHCLAATFGRYRASLEPGGPPLIPDLQDREVTAGATFSYGSGMRLRLTQWDPPHSFAYATTGSGVSATMHIEIAEISGQLTLVVRRTERRTGVMAIGGRIFNLAKGAAYGTLDSLVGPASRNASAWAGVWKALPIHRGAIELS